MQATDVTALDGRIVLVTSAKDHRNPPTGRRGTIRVRERAGHPLVAIEIEFPQMFATRARLHTLLLTDSEVAQLVASEHNGAFSVTVQDQLDPAAPADDE